MDGILPDHVWMDRRRFIRFGVCVTILPFVGSGLPGCSFLSPEPIENWDQLAVTADKQGQLKIEKIDGEAISSSMQLKPGMALSSGEEIELKSGTVLASLPDRSLIRLSSQARFAATLDSQKGGVLHLKRGGLLAVVNKSVRRPYLIRNAAAVVGIKGTVFYSQVLSETDKKADNIPADATDYFCICNGAIDILSRQFENVKSDRAFHHNAYFLKPTSETLSIKRAGFLLNHSDEEIYDVIKQMKGKKHDSKWLFSDMEMYSG